ncbi:hypothetical protein CMUS01_01655 [Colletotrichum musicola]|uniref:Uncharacterized protein n=1 Tax=Colletotrichum musicola TaxID=2175873 RepID=A0A8H6U7W1_9PEZI|nr:hypothetical protein CMUS01_01655 [Colletotrichum musicola]
MTLVVVAVQKPSSPPIHCMIQFATRPPKTLARVMLRMNCCSATSRKSSFVEEAGRVGKRMTSSARANTRAQNPGPLIRTDRAGQPGGFVNRTRRLSSQASPPGPRSFVAGLQRFAEGHVGP